MAYRTNFGSAKRARELKRLKKREEKRLRRMARKAGAAPGPLPAQPEGESAVVQETEGAPSETVGE